jgi:3-dehydroquinate dehydratase II
VKILILNGPNLNMLGKREPTIYGQLTFDEYLNQVRNQFSTHTIDYFQSNIEGELIGKLQDSDLQEYKGIVFNAGGYSHTSVAIADAVAAIQTPVRATQGVTIAICTRRNFWPWTYGLHTCYSVIYN